MKKICSLLFAVVVLSGCNHGASVIIRDGVSPCGVAANNRYAPPRPQYRYDQRLGWYVDSPCQNK